MCTGVKVSDPLELEPQTAVSMWMLGTEPKSSAQASSDRNHSAISPAVTLSMALVSGPHCLLREQSDEVKASGS